MIAGIIEDDHDAGRELLAAIGNAPQPAWEERAGEMQALAERWRAHGAMLEQAVFPALGTGALGAGEGSVGEFRDLHRTVAGLAEDLARRAPSGETDGHWLTDFERLKAAFDTQCERESGALVRQIRERLTPDAIGEMTRRARALRQPRAA
ncbi:hemerythrin domain-containing protein [Azospirillum sp.]|uniref:hemerythrin domain-containing protein n=1 Tax=Azospirillum sp. TaxID=34012 RepID=UPI002D2FF573|nr:hemerythrin domain-containing protein [Azospirillum sp.]HYD66279.1 hemerythrin domain-containing protein [Azospirillum sp.]